MKNTLIWLGLGLLFSGCGTIILTEEPKSQCNDNLCVHSLAITSTNRQMDFTENGKKVSKSVICDNLASNSNTINASFKYVGSWKSVVIGLQKAYGNVVNNEYVFNNTSTSTSGSYNINNFTLNTKAPRALEQRGIVVTPVPNVIGRVQLKLTATDNTNQTLTPLVTMDTLPLVDNCPIP